MLTATDPAAGAKLTPARPEFVSVPFLILRGISVAGLIAASIIQIFVLARILSPQTFSIFILVGTVGYSLWLIDFGVVKFLFVRLRAMKLAGTVDQNLTRQSTAIASMYTLLSVAGTLLCLIVLIALQLTPVDYAAAFALFFMYNSLNFPWYALRYISIAVDDYVFFESVEAVRRFVSIALLLSMLGGLPIAAFLVLVNVAWAVALTLVITRLRRKQILGGQLRGMFSTLLPFYRDNRLHLIRTGTSTTSVYYFEHLPYLVVPILFGLGAPTVIVDAIFKFVRGAEQYYYAICDIVVPQQTKAIAARDARTLLFSTLLALGLAVIPTAVVAAGLIFAGELFFKLLLGPAATMPPEAIWIIIALLFSTLVQILAHSLLIHSGYFKEAARVMGFTAAAVTLAAAIALFGSPSIVGFLSLYAAAFACGALMQVVLAATGPIRAARNR